MSKIRQHKNEGRLCGDDRAEAVRAILERSPLEPHAAVAEALGLHRETVRKIRFGIQWPDVLPGLPRLDPAASGANCYRCCHWSQSPGDDPGTCTLGIPEAVTDGQLYARGCGAYLAQARKS